MARTQFMWVSQIQEETPRQAGGGGGGGRTAACITHANSLLALNEGLKLFGASVKPW